MKKAEKMNDIVEMISEMLLERRASIGRFAGKSKFSRKTILKILKAIVSSTGNERESNFNILIDEKSPIKLVEKMDSMFCHFGLDKAGTFFMESSNIGPVYETNVEKKFGFSQDLLQSFRYLNSNQDFQDSLKTVYSTVGPFRYDAELFPVLTHKGTKNGDIIFTGTPYSRKKLGSKGAFVLFSCKLWNSTYENWTSVSEEQSSKLTSLLKRESKREGWSSDWKIYTNEEDMRLSGELQVELGPILAGHLKGDGSFQRAVNILDGSSSLEKRELQQELDRIGQELQDALNDFSNNVKSNLGNNSSYVEGVILKVKDSNGEEYEVKGTSNEFDKRKKTFWKDRENFLSLEKEMESRILKDLLNFSTTHPASINKLIKKAADSFSPTAVGKKRELEFLKHLVPFVSNGEVEFSETAINELISEFSEKFSRLVKEYSSNKKRLDFDSNRKTVEILNRVKEYINKLKNINIDNNTYLRLLKDLIGFRIDKIINFELGNKKDSKKRKKVVMWNGRAQPWHKGHDEMVQIGKQEAKELGADLVYIILVKGEGTGEDLEKNPLSEEEQYQLVKSVYENDPEVEVSNRFSNSSFIVDLLSGVHDKGYEVVGWLAGDDRFEKYQNSLRSFSPTRYSEDHEYSPIKKNENGDVLVKMIRTPRVMSGEKARKIARNSSFRTFLEKVAPINIDVNAKGSYKQAYDKIRNPTVDEISTMGAGGAVEIGSSNALNKKEKLIREVMDYLLCETRSLQ